VVFFFVVSFLLFSSANHSALNKSHNIYYQCHLRCPNSYVHRRPLRAACLAVYSSRFFFLFWVDGGGATAACFAALSWAARLRRATPEVGGSG